MHFLLLHTLANLQICTPINTGVVTLLTVNRLFNIQVVFLFSLLYESLLTTNCRIKKHIQKNYINEKRKRKIIFICVLLSIKASHTIVKKTNST